MPFWLPWRDPENASFTWCGQAVPRIVVYRGPCLRRDGRARSGLGLARTTRTSASIGERAARFRSIEAPRGVAQLSLSYVEVTTSIGTNVHGKGKGTGVPSAMGERKWEGTYSAKTFRMI